VLLKNVGAINPESIEEYIASDGYLALEKAFNNGPDWVIEEVKKSELRGRGGAGFQQVKSGSQRKMQKVTRSILYAMQMKENQELLKIEFLWREILIY